MKTLIKKQGLKKRDRDRLMDRQRMLLSYSKQHDINLDFKQ